MAQPGEPERVAYLPPRAARARKLILRGQLGLPWVLAALAAAAVILVAGTAFLVRSGRPVEPWVRVGPAAAHQPGTVTQAPGPEGRVLVIDRRGTVRAFLVQPAPCEVRAAGDGFARACTGERWDPSGRPSKPGPALERVPAQLSHGDLYVRLDEEARRSRGSPPAG